VCNAFHVFLSVVSLSLVFNVRTLVLSAVHSMQPSSNYIGLWFFDPTHRSNRGTGAHDQWLKRRVSEQGGAFWGLEWRVTPFGGNMLPKKGAWIGNFKPKHQNIKIAITPKLLIRSSPNLKGKLRPTTALHGWPIIIVYQIQHGGRPPSCKSRWRHISEADSTIWIKFSRPMQNHMPMMTIKWSEWEPEVEI